MSIANWPRFLVSLVIGLALALGLGAQALSSVSTRTAPETAISLFPSNGLAREQLAFANFTARVAEPDDIQDAARSAYPVALATLYSDPLSPKAHAILALAADDRAARGEILNAAAKLNRRDLSLQGLLLQDHVAADDYARTIETLDQILRVHPERAQEFFPVLVEALSNSETIPLFAELLDNSSPWHVRFLAFALRQRDVLPNLARLRLRIDVENDAIDRSLIASLAGSEDVELASALYQSITRIDMSTANQAKLDWRSDFPPFDWRLVDEPGFRAQQSQDGDAIELSVRPGKGGVIAARLLNAPNGPFRINIEHRIAPAQQLRDVRLQLVCTNVAEPVFDERFSRQGDGFRIESLPNDCAYLVLAINARAWSGRSALNGTIQSIRISQ
uniref:hypothetical protein n=1 Tax=uncultured Altererythrobacter sp. TaxID=500840 RepID=UPI0026386C86|nr:hypothetical protein [uncultured Altererythrobacter sp.]